MSMKEESIPKFIHLHPAPPKDFNPLNESNSTLLKHGIPPRPDKHTHPRLRSKWEQAMSKRPTYVRPSFETIPKRIRSRPQKDGVTFNGTDVHWSGAVIENPPTGETFNTVIGTWIIPNPYPPISALLSDGTWADGQWECACWVGIDGWNLDELLQAGTAQTVTTSGGQIQSQTAYAWIEWWTDNPSKITTIDVKPGDTVSFSVCTPFQDNWGTTTVFNESSNKYTVAGIPAPGTDILQGTTAEWIVEDPWLDAAGDPTPFANYGSTVFFDCVAGSKTQERDINDASLINIVQGGITLSEAAAENASVLLVRVPPPTS
jgi:Peptidase A4 family